MKILNLFAVLLLALIPTRVAAQTMDVQPTRIEWSDSTRLALGRVGQAVRVAGMKILNLFAVLLLALIPTRVAAQTMDVQPTRIEWSDSTRLALAQCLLGEAGWRRRTEHSAISHVLLRRWHRLGSGSFEGRVRRYCSVHRTTQPTDRHQWVRNMPWGPLLEDPGLPAGVNWRNYIDDWDYVRTTVELFEKSALVDPLPRARHWGGAMDGIPVGGVTGAEPWTVSLSEGCSSRARSETSR